LLNKVGLKILKALGINSVYETIKLINIFVLTKHSLNQFIMPLKSFLIPFTNK